MKNSVGPPGPRGYTYTHKRKRVYTDVYHTSYAEYREIY